MSIAGDPRGVSIGARYAWALAQHRLHGARLREDAVVDRLLGELRAHVIASRESMLAAGLDGIERELDCGEPVNRNIFDMSQREKKRLKIVQLPASLDEALDFMEKDKMLRESLGDHIFDHFLYNKRTEWSEYIKEIHDWELDRYLDRY